MAPELWLLPSTALFSSGYLNAKSFPPWQSTLMHLYAISLTSTVCKKKALSFFTVLSSLSIAHPSSNHSIHKSDQREGWSLSLLISSLPWKLIQIVGESASLQSLFKYVLETPSLETYFILTLLPVFPNSGQLVLLH